MIVLDTDFLIGFLKEQEPTVEKMWALLQGSAPLAVTAVNYAEVLVGAKEQTSKYGQVKALLDGFTFLSLDKRASLDTVRIQQMLQKKGKRLNILDEYIAGICRSNNATLVTRNTKHFNRVKDLKLETW